MPREQPPSPQTSGSAANQSFAGIGGKGCKVKHLGARKGCFIAGTSVHTDQGLKPIEQIRVGDRVLSQPEGGGELAYKPVVDTFSYEDKEVWVLKYTTSDPNKVHRDDMVYHLYATANHPFWVEGKGWTALEALRENEKLRLADGSTAWVVIHWPVLRTPHPEIGWVSADLLGSVRWYSLDDYETAHVVDFRHGCNLWQYPMWRPKDVGVLHTSAFSIRLEDKLGAEMAKGILDMFDEGIAKFFTARVYNLKVEDFHTYYVGEQGVWVRTA